MRNLPVLRCCAALVVASAISTGLATPASWRSHPKLSGDLVSRLSSGDPGGSIDVIIQADGADLSDLRAHVGQRGGAAIRELGLVDGLAASVPASEIEELAKHVRVRRISPDRPIAAAMDVAAMAAGAGWSRDLTPPDGSPSGRGIGVAVIDSGVYPHEDLDGAIRVSVDYVDPVRQGNDLARDPYGHGTHIAGIIAGRPVASLGGHGGVLGGIAPGAHLISLRVLDHKGAGRSSDVIAALDWCVRHREEHGIRVVNLSLGQPVAEPAADDPLVAAVERAWASGLVVVAAAGNAGALVGGYGMISSPANDPLAIAVGALDDRATVATDDDVVPEFSSKGPTRFDFTVKPDLVAPGARIVSLRVPHSTLDRALPEARVALTPAGNGLPSEPRYFEMSGSSMATALVSGAVAVMLEAEPSLTPDDVKARLMRQSNHALAQDIFTRGAGSIDIGAALAAEGRARVSASPVVSLVGGTKGVLIGETGEAWGDEALWGLEDLYGDPTLWDEFDTQILMLFDDACMTGQGVTWQHAVANGVTWQHAIAEGVIWQTLTSEGVTWQHLKGSGVTWQHLKGTGVTWQHSLGDGTCPY